MLLRYNTYLKLMQALKEHAQQKKYKRLYNVYERQNEIYEHFIWKYNIFMAENAVGDIKAFWKPKEKVKDTRKKFRKFMNV